MRLPIIESLLVGRASQNDSPRIVTTNTTITIPVVQPAWAERLSPTLAGLSIEMDHWPSWAGSEIGKPNAFTNQVLQNLAERTGVPPYLRIGADSEDKAHIDLSFQVINTTYPAATATNPTPAPDTIAIGRDFYALSGNLLKGTSFLWGLNFKYHNLTETVAQASLLADAFQGSRSETTENVKLLDIELGNEPDYWSITGTAYGYDASWTPTNYSDHWRKYAKAVSGAIDLKQGGTTFSAAGFGAIGDTVTWTPAAVLEAGLLQDAVTRARTGSFAMHHYSGVNQAQPLALVGQLMDKVTIRNNMSVMSTRIKDVRSVGLPFILSETNSYANHGMAGTSNTAEAAIWATDYVLQAASLGIERIHLHNGLGYRYNLFQPTAGADDGLNLTSRAHILPSYHAFLIANEAIGTSGNASIAEISTTNQSIAAYGIWEKETLTRMVLINSQVYTSVNGSLPSTRNGLTVNLKNWKQGSYATVKRLAIPYTDAFSGLTWANQTFETESGKPEGTVYEEPLYDGTVELEASSIALICFK